MDGLREGMSAVGGCGGGGGGKVVVFCCSRLGSMRRDGWTGMMNRKRQISHIENSRVDTVYYLSRSVPRSTGLLSRYLVPH